eukprot:11835497-Karenia_brevis.AAC.1
MNHNSTGIGIGAQEQQLAAAFEIGGHLAPDIGQDFVRACHAPSALFNPDSNGWSQSLAPGN